MEREDRIVREESGPGPYPESRYTDQPVASSDTEVVSRFSPARRAYETIYLIFAIIVGAIFIRVLLKVMGANTAVAFTSFMYSITDSLLAPFHGLLPTFVSGRTVLEVSALFAMLIYGLIGIALARLFAIMFMRDVTVAHGSRSRQVRPRVE
jgi:uncharacterized protein YggT (Ycf19 family)